MGETGSENLVEGIHRNYESLHTDAKLPLNGEGANMSFITIPVDTSYFTTNREK